MNVNPIYLIVINVDPDLQYTVKKVIDFPAPAGMSLTKLSLAGNNLITPGQGEFG
jgi:hypothetical protein